MTTQQHQHQRASVIVAVFITGMAVGYFMAPDYESIREEVVYEIRQALNDNSENNGDEDNLTEYFPTGNVNEDKADTNHWENGILSYEIRDSLAYIIYVENGDTLSIDALYQEEVDTLIKRLYGENAWDEWIGSKNEATVNNSQLLQ